MLGYNDWRDAVLVYGFMLLTLVGTYRLCTMDIPPIENKRITNIFYSAPIAPVSLNLLVIVSSNSGSLEDRAK